MILWKSFMRNVKKTFDLSRYNITRVKNLLEKYTIIAYFYISLNSELNRYSQFYDISVSNEQTKRAAFSHRIFDVLSIRIAPVGSFAREFTCSKARAQCYVTLADLLEARWHQGQTARDFSQWELAKKRARERPKRKKSPLVNSLTRVNRERDIPLPDPSENHPSVPTVYNSLRGPSKIVSSLYVPPSSAFASHVLRGVSPGR